MKQDTQSLLNSLSKLETDWKDDFAITVISFLDQIKIEGLDKGSEQLIQLLEYNFDVASTVFRLFLDWQSRRNNYG
ncbi:MAG: hypothetical protein PF693_18340 [Spirochaetia bacterium]|nr:hypothetical protein [Spirochaetia bacterium]